MTLVIFGLIPRQMRLRILSSTIFSSPPTRMRRRRPSIKQRGNLIRQAIRRIGSEAVSPMFRLQQHGMVEPWQFASAEIRRLSATRVKSFCLSFAGIRRSVYLRDASLNVWVPQHLVPDYGICYARALKAVEFRAADPDYKDPLSNEASIRGCRAGEERSPRD